MTNKKTSAKTAIAEDTTMDLFADTPASGGAGNGNVTPPATVSGGGEDTIDMATFAERSYLTYAMSVVRGRAIPNVEDGQKPVWSLHGLFA